MNPPPSPRDLEETFLQKGGGCENLQSWEANLWAMEVAVFNVGSEEKNRARDYAEKTASFPKSKVEVPVKVSFGNSESNFLVTILPKVQESLAKF